jgi:hypothetical protein
MTTQTNTFVRGLNHQVLKRRNITIAEQKVLDSRYVPDGYRLAQGITYTTQVFFKDVSVGTWIALIFLGKAVRPTKHVRFSTKEGRQAYVDNVLKNYQVRQENTENRKKQQEQPSNLKVGDILYTSWGYDQTNVEFFQVVKTIGKRTVELVRVACTSSSRSDYTDDLMPIKDSFITEGYRSEENGTYRVKNGNTVSFNSYKNGWLWDGKPKYQTALEYGH